MRLNSALSITVLRVQLVTVKGSRALPIIVRVLGASSAVAVLFFSLVYAFSEWKMRRTSDAPI